MRILIQRMNSRAGKISVDRRYVCSAGYSGFFVSCTEKMSSYVGIQDENLACDVEADSTSSME